MSMTEIEVVQGAAMLLAKKLCIDTNATNSSITIGGMWDKKDPNAKARNFRVTIKELSDKEVEHYEAKESKS